jgi:hypothetical protein
MTAAGAHRRWFHATADSRDQADRGPEPFARHRRTLPQRVFRPCSAVPDVMVTDRPRRSRADYERGLPDHHDPTAGIGGAAPAQSALTLRAVLAAFGLVFCAGAAWFAFAAHLGVIGWVAAVVSLVALVDLVVVLNRKRRGEPG